RFRLRPHTIDDVASVRQLWANPDVVSFISGTPSTPEESWARLLRYIGHWAAFGTGYFAILDKPDGRYLGECGFMEFQREITPSLAGSAEVGWVLMPDAWGRGVAFEAMTAILGWYGDRPDALPLSCIIAPGNAASIKVASKLGFALETETLYRERPTLVFRRG
ncbi:MAG: GNAT family N-acetyltransferase, partial [Bosea sp. (in: a-proteobacteria)]